MKEQLQLFLTAVMFYTRIPVPKTAHHYAEKLSLATKYLPLIGWITGGACVLALYGLAQVWPYPVALLLSMAISLWLTGAFHEDGLADFCDGFGGGWTKAQILDIMKDSRIGTYGMAGLLLVMLLKFYCLYSLGLPHALLALWVAHPLSRFAAVTIIYTDPYARENEDAKAKPVAQGIRLPDLLLAGLLAVLPLAVLLWQEPGQGAQAGLLCAGWLIAPTLARWCLLRLMRKWIGGYTGDCLGAVQQAAEISIYLVSCAVWRTVA
ncbi:MAG TPA: adenosylcobinamide-GDP ribazoletransferase [Chitinophaga sp.]